MTTAKSLVLTLLMGVVAAACAHDSSPRESKQGIESKVRRWFALLESSSRGERTVDNLLTDGPFEFTQSEVDSLGPVAFRQFVTDLRSQFQHVEFRLEKIRTDKLDDGLVRVKFEFERHSIDESGTPHVMRSKQIWKIRNSQATIATVVRIDVHRLILFPGTGPQIVCY